MPDGLPVAPARVEIEFTISSQTSNFVLSDATRGVLGSTTYLLGGAIWTDVSDRVYQISIDRGRSEALGRYNAGTMSVVFDNEDAQLDPTIPAGTTGFPWAGQIVPGKRIRVWVGTELQYLGVIQDWDLEYPLGGRALAIARAADYFVQLANRSLAAYTTTAAVSSTVLSAMLDRAEVAFSSFYRDIATGNTTLQATTVTVGTNALSFAQLIEASEPGALFVSKDGYLTFRTRRSNPSLISAITISDSGTSITPRSIHVEYGSELLYNRANITRTGGTTQTYNATSSQDTYGIFTYDQDGLLMDSDAIALSIAQYYANTFATPAFRPRKITIDMAAQTAPNQGLLQQIDLDDLVVVSFTPPGGFLIERDMVIVGIHHRIGVGRHEIDLDLIDAQGQSMIWGDPAVSPDLQPLAKLDSNRYGI